MLVYQACALNGLLAFLSILSRRRPIVHCPTHAGVRVRNLLRTPGRSRKPMQKTRCPTEHPEPKSNLTCEVRPRLLARLAAHPADTPRPRHVQCPPFPRCPLHDSTPPRSSVYNEPPAPARQRLRPTSTAHPAPAHHRHMTTPRHHAAARPLAVLTLLLLLVGPGAAQPPSRDKDNGGGGGGGGGYMQQNQPPSFSAPMVVLLVALIVAFFFIGFFSVYMRRCGRGTGPTTFPAAALLALSRQEQRNQQQQQRGLDPAVVASFPTMKYAEAKALRVGGGKDAATLECAVCLSEFADDEELCLLPPCSHAFHPDCIGEWLAGHVTCPVCRCNLDPAAAEDLAAASSGEEEVAGEGHHEQDHQVGIDVTRDGDEEERREEAMELERIGSQRRAVRSRSGRPDPPVPRSHSTGHSLAARLGGDDLERFTLRLPEHVRREIVAAAGEESLRRTGRDREGRAGAGARSARLGRSDRWPSFITRTFSSRVPFWPSSAASRRAPDAEAAAAAAAAGTTEASAATARIKQREKTADGSTVTTPKGSVRFDCLGGGGAAVSSAAGDSETEEDDDEEKAIARHRQA